MRFRPGSSRWPSPGRPSTIRRALDPPPGVCACLDGPGTSRAAPMALMAPSPPVASEDPGGRADSSGDPPLPGSGPPSDSRSPLESPASRRRGRRSQTAATPNRSPLGRPAHRWPASARALHRGQASRTRPRHPQTQELRRPSGPRGSNPPDPPLPRPVRSTRHAPRFPRTGARRPDRYPRWVRAPHHRRRSPRRRG